MDRKYWIGVASKNHVLRGIAGEFAQLCHGKMTPLKKMKPGDWIVYYSPTYVFGKKDPCRAFTAIGKILEKEPYQLAMSESFVPWRRDVSFLSSKEVSIYELLDSLSFISNKEKWGFPFRRGYFSIPQKDFEKIQAAMKIRI